MADTNERAASAQGKSGLSRRQFLAGIGGLGVGVVLGIFGVAKAIEWLMAKCPTPTYCGVLGLVLASPVAILLNPDIQWNNVGHIIAGVVTFAVGFAAAMLLSRMGKEEKVQQ